MDFSFHSAFSLVLEETSVTLKIARDSTQLKIFKRRT